MFNEVSFYSNTGIHIFLRNLKNRIKVRFFSPFGRFLSFVVNGNTLCINLIFHNRFVSVTLAGRRVNRVEQEGRTSQAVARRNVVKIGFH